jgi:hypothetical protein
MPPANRLQFSSKRYLATGGGGQRQLQTVNRFHDHKELVQDLSFYPVGARFFQFYP